MASEFVLHLVTERSRGSVLEYLSEMLSFQENKGEDCLIGPGVLVYTIEASSRRQLLMSEKFGFRPTLTLRFRIQPKENYSEGKSSVLKATLALLEGRTRDGVLLFNDEEIVLQKIGGQLVFNEKFSLWDRLEMHQLTDSSYEIRSLPSPLL